jgi:hypothetical protein
MLWAAGIRLVLSVIKSALYRDILHYPIFILLVQHLTAHGGHTLYQ